MTASSGFIELNRRFHPLDPASNPEDSALASYTARMLGREAGLGWDELLECGLVVVLGEPGSGKTAEFRHRTAALRSQGQHAFFVPLDRLASEPLDSVLEPGDHRRFQRWRRSRRLAAFFLDSVDEAKHHRESDFWAALDRIRSGIGVSALTRAQVVVSSRISEWRPRSDTDQVLTRFPGPPRARRDTQDPDNHQYGRRASERILVVQLLPLDEPRIRSLAAGVGLPDHQEFLEALNHQHAWEFARRPIDVIDLANYWSTHRRLGSLTELIEHDLEHKIQETDTRQGHDPLTPQQAREGAETLATAATFCREFGFRVPDQVHATERSGIDAHACLPADWLSNHCRALLARALFDSASYGRIRFHHRRVQEYLAACWLRRRVEEGLPVPTLRDLLFAQNRGSWVARPSLAPITAWLASGAAAWTRELRSWILSAAPTIHLQYGDPASLPVEYRRELLRHLIDRHTGREQLWVTMEPEALSRLADPALAPDVAAVMRDRSICDDLREMTLHLARHGRLVGCVDAALDVLADDTETDDMKCYAAALVRDVGEPPHRARLAVIANQMGCVRTELCAFVCEALYPSTIGAPELASLLRQAAGVPRSGVDLPWYLSKHLEAALDPSDAGPLLEQFVDLAQETPHITVGEHTAPVSARFCWLGQVIPTAVMTLLRKPRLTSAECQCAACALWLLGHLRHHGELHDNLPDGLSDATARHPEVRRCYFWRLVREFPEQHGSEPSRLFQLYDHYEVLKPAASDIHWLADDIRGRVGRAEAEVALRVAVELLDACGKPREAVRQIGHAAAQRESLFHLLRSLLRDRRSLALRRLWYRTVGRTVGNAHWWRLRKRELQEAWQWGRTQWVLTRNRERLASGERTDWLCHLSHEAAADNETSRWTPRTWAGLRKRHLPWVVAAAKTGCKRAWHHFTPPLPHEKPDPTRTDHRVIVGLTGIRTAITDGDLDLAELTEQETALATRYAVDELNGFAPWLYELGRARPNAVRDVLMECVRGAWGFDAERERSQEVLYDLMWRGEGLVDLVETQLVEQLEGSDPRNASILEFALCLLLGRPEPPAHTLSELAATRISQYAPDSRSYMLWVCVWIQTDALAALAHLEHALLAMDQPDDFVIRLCNALTPERAERFPLAVNPDHVSPAALRRMIPLVFQYVRPEDDIDRSGEGTYTPTPRDHAESFRGRLLPRLALSDGPEAETHLWELIEVPALASRRDFILHLLDERAERLGDLPPWEAEDVREFAESYETDPRTDRDLFAVVCRRIDDVRHDVETADDSIRDQLRSGDDEITLRRWLARELRRRSRGRYTVPEEEEIDQRQRPDVRVEAPRTGPVSIEIKWADLPHWSMTRLIERLENQLVGQYLRDRDARYGVYLLATFGRKAYWVCSDTGRHLSFEQVVAELGQRAIGMVSERSDVDDVAVVGIDFANPGNYQT